MAHEKPECGLKSGGGRGKSSGYRLVKENKISSQFEGNCRNDDIIKFQNGRSTPPKESERPFVPGNRNAGSVAVPPQCFVSHMDRCDSRRRFVNCRKFRSVNPSEIQNTVFKARHCFDCLENHVVKDCTEWCDCRRC